MVSLGEKEFIPADDENTNYADPNKYYIWQSYEQEIHKFDHSIETKALVHCMQFIENIGSFICFFFITFFTYKFRYNLNTDNIYRN